MSAIITGEAVVLELRPASFAARSLGTAIDVAATLLVGLGLLLLLGGPALELWIRRPCGPSCWLAAVTLFVIVPITVETLSRGKSLGKLAMGLRIVSDDGGSIRFRHALIRGLLAVLEIYMTLGSVACLVSLFNDKSKRLGDMLAGTYAIRDRAKEPNRCRFSWPSAPGPVGCRGGHWPPARPAGPAHLPVPAPGRRHGTGASRFSLAAELAGEASAST